MRDWVSPFCFVNSTVLGIFFRLNKIIFVSTISILWKCKNEYLNHLPHMCAPSAKIQIKIHKFIPAVMSENLNEMNSTDKLCILVRLKSGIQFFSPLIITFFLEWEKKKKGWWDWGLWGHVSLPLHDTVVATAHCLQ